MLHSSRDVSYRREHKKTREERFRRNAKILLENGQVSPFENFQRGRESCSFCYPTKLAELKCLWCLNDSEGLFCKRCNGIKIWGLPGKIKSSRSMLYFLDIVRKTVKTEDTRRIFLSSTGAIKSLDRAEEIGLNLKLSQLFLYPRGI